MMAEMLGVPVQDFGKDLRKPTQNSDDDHFEEPMDPLMAESVTERTLDRREHYVLLEQLYRGDITWGEFKTRLTNVALTHKVNLEEEKREEEESCA